jgi:hypothetical protein
MSAVDSKTRMLRSLEEEVMKNNWKKRRVEG